MIKVTRTTTESAMEVILTPPPVAKDYRSKIQTPLPFLNHMIEQTVWRSGFNIQTKVQLSNFTLAHLVTEDLGQALGKAFARLLEKCDSAPGFGDGFGMIDEALAHSVISFESRSYFAFHPHVEVSENVEGMASEELLVFLDAFCQGANCTLQIDLTRGENTHHLWEAVFRSFGTALKNTFTPDNSRAGMTSGVAGKVLFTIEEV